MSFVLSAADRVEHEVGTFQDIGCDGSLWLVARDNGDECTEFLLCDRGGRVIRLRIREVCADEL